MLDKSKAIDEWTKADVRAMEEEEMREILEMFPDYKAETEQ